uniref:Uncharacterized protein n=1 Tax=Tanacetum cinerariifolium TaxID=118510 RepID=A0A699IC68_TANCI|nr:hypothetical protein [Tanacetum cinerariifolium]
MATLSPWHVKAHSSILDFRLLKYWCICKTKMAHMRFRGVAVIIKRGLQIVEVNPQVRKGYVPPPTSGCLVAHICDATTTKGNECRVYFLEHAVAYGDIRYEVLYEEALRDSLEKARAVSGIANAIA